MKVNVRKDAGVLNPSTGEFLEFDIYLPSLRLAFEYHVMHPLHPNLLARLINHLPSIFLPGKTSLHYSSIQLQSLGRDKEPR